MVPFPSMGSEEPHLASVSPKVGFNLSADRHYVDPYYDDGHKQSVHNQLRSTRVRDLMRCDPNIEPAVPGGINTPQSKWILNQITTPAGKGTDWGVLQEMNLHRTNKCLNSEQVSNSIRTDYKTTPVNKTIVNPDHPMVSINPKRNSSSRIYGVMQQHGAKELGYSNIPPDGALIYDSALISHITQKRHLRLGNESALMGTIIGPRGNDVSEQASSIPSGKKLLKSHLVDTEMGRLFHFAYAKNDNEDITGTAPPLRSAKSKWKSGPKNNPLKWGVDVLNYGPPDNKGRSTRYSPTHLDWIYVPFESTDMLPPPRPAAYKQFQSHMSTACIPTEEGSLNEVLNRKHTSHTESHLQTNFIPTKDDSFQHNKIRNARRNQSHLCSSFVPEVGTTTRQEGRRNVWNFGLGVSSSTGHLEKGTCQPTEMPHHGQGRKQINLEKATNKFNITLQHIADEPEYPMKANAF